MPTRKLLPVAVRLCLAGVLGCAAYFLPAQGGEGTLSVEIWDDASGRLTPAMVSITSHADGKWRRPPDGRVVPSYTRVPDFLDPKPWSPGEPGPVRLTIGNHKDNWTRSAIYGERSTYPFWREPAAYFIDRPFSIRLPAGKVRLCVARGIEYLPLIEEIQIAPGQPLVRKVRLKRWVDMAKSGWYSGDDHVHYPRLKPWHDEFLMTWALAEDVHVVNSLRMGDMKRITYEQAAYGKAGRYQRGDYALVSGQEDPRSDIHEQGHALALNITAPVRDTSRYQLYDLMFDAVHAQGGVTGYAHKAWAWQFFRQRNPDANPTWDSTINVVRDKIDFFEILQFRYLGVEDFYDFLNLGFRVTASAGSDFPVGGTIGEARVYVYTGHPFSVDSWFEAFRKGRTFVTNGPMVTLTVNGAIPGQEVKAGRNETLRVRARAWAPPAIGTPKLLEIVAHGRVIRSAAPRNEKRGALELDFRVPATESQWIAARVSSDNDGFAHTSPVYVRVGDEKFWAREEVPQLVEKRLRILDYIQERFETQEAIRDISPETSRALRDRIGDARRLYRELRDAAVPRSP